jgi:hypothetical protein
MSANNGYGPHICEEENCMAWIPKVKSEFNDAIYRKGYCKLIGEIE